MSFLDTGATVGVVNIGGFKNITTNEVANEGLRKPKPPVNPMSDQGREER
jgi:hypothetical protein